MTDFCIHSTRENYLLMCWPSKVPEHTIFGMLKTCFQLNDKVVFIGGNDLTDHEKPDKNRTIKLLNACIPDQVARELKPLPGAKKTADTCGIPSRADLHIVFPRANDLLRQSHTNYVFVGTSKGLHCVIDSNGIHLSNWQLGNFKMTLGQRLFGWPKKSQQCATKI